MCVSALCVCMSTVCVRQCSERGVCARTECVCVCERRVHRCSEEGEGLAQDTGQKKRHQEAGAALTPPFASGDKVHTLITPRSHSNYTIRFQQLVG